LDRGSGLLGDLELNRLARLLLDNGSAVSDPAAGTNIVHLQPHEIAASEFAIDSEVEQGEIAGAVLQPKPDPDRPHLLGLQRSLLTDEASPYSKARGMVHAVGFCRA
jgi:hypothetical protein